jgi:hypothetical protein
VVESVEDGPAGGQLAAPEQTGVTVATGTGTVTEEAGGTSPPSVQGGVGAVKVSVVEGGRVTTAGVLA